jgi:glycosyltransferase involved in cell wall biosynthesis
MKKVLIITYYWPPSGGAGVQRWLKFAKYLPEFGYQPFILTVDENYASYAQLDKSLLEEVDPLMPVCKTKTFEPYNLYKKLSEKKEIPYGGFSNQKKITLFEKFSRFVRGNLFLPDPRRGWNRYALKKALTIIQEEGIEQVITSGPPHSTHLIGMALKKRAGIKWMADFRDPWTDIYYYKELFHSKIAGWLDRRMEKNVLSKADKIITVSGELGKLLQKKIAEPNPKILVLPNGYDESDFVCSEAIHNELFTITYTGTVSSIYRINKFIEAVSQLPDEIKNELKIRFVGNVPEEIIQLFHQKGLGNRLEILGYVSHNQAIRYMKGASVLLLAIPDSPDNKGIVTGKFFEYLASNRPILAIGPVGGDVDRMIQKCQAGKLFTYEETEKMKLYLLELVALEKQGKNQGGTSGAGIYTRRKLTQVLSENL